MHRFLVIGAVATLALAVCGDATAWSWPADGAVLRSFALGEDAYAGGQHRGIDVSGPDGSQIRAPASGLVTFAGTLPTYGRGVTILTADGYSVTLVHLGAIGVSKGDPVGEGSPVGTMGWSGTPEQSVPSVHLGIRRASDEEGYVDPLGLLPPRATPSPPSGDPAPSPVPATPPAPAVSPAAPPVPAAPAPVTPPAAVTAPLPVTTPAAPVGAAPVAEATPATQPEVGTAAPAATPEAEAWDGPVARPSPSSGLTIQATPDVGERAARPPRAPTALAHATGRAHPASSVGRGASRAAVPRPSPAGADTAQRRPPTPGVGAVPEARSTTRVENAPPRPTAAMDSASSPRSQATNGAPAELARRVPTHGAGGLAPVRPPQHVAHDATAMQAFQTRGAPPSSRAEPEPALGAAAGHGVGLAEVAAAIALSMLVAAVVGRRAARRIGGNGAVLRHHADLLRQLDAAYRARVHHRGRGRLRPPSAAART